MSELIKTLHKKGDASVEIYPNIKAENIPASAINTSKLEDGAVTESKIYDASVSRNKLAYKCVNSDKLDDASVTTDKLNDSSVTTAKINDGAITTTKLGNNAITTAKLNNGSVTTSKLAMHVYNYVIRIDVSVDGYELRIANLSNTSFSSLTIADILSMIFNTNYDWFIPITYKLSPLEEYKVGCIKVASDYSSITFNEVDGTTHTINASNLNLIDWYKIQLI